MTCKHCEKPIIRCGSAPSHFGCSSARGYLHDSTRAHGCKPRSDGPYAEPVHDEARDIGARRAAELFARSGDENWLGI